MTDLLPPYHKPMTSQLDCDLANDRIAALEAENEALRAELDTAAIAIVTWQRKCGMDPFSMEEVLAAIHEQTHGRQP